MQITETIHFITKQLMTAGYDAAEGESVARLLAAHLLDIPYSLLPLAEGEFPDEDLDEPLARLMAGEPLQYVLGETEFMGLPFRTSPHALIPRGDSECLLEKAITVMKGVPHPHIGDICTGSGSFALAAAHYLPSATVEASDISEEALALAKENAEALGLSKRVTFYAGDMGEPLIPFAPYDMILCNPPYIRSAEIADLPKQLRFEPRLALDGGEDGLTPYRVLADQAFRLLKEGGYLLVEHGDDQQQEVGAILAVPGMEIVENMEDWGHRPRGILLRKVTA